jgi:hypothetical protein
MELDQPTPVFHPPFLECHQRTTWHTPDAKAFDEKGPLSGGYTTWCVGTIKEKEGRIQVLASLATSSQTV